MKLKSEQAIESDNPDYNFSAETRAAFADFETDLRGIMPELEEVCIRFWERAEPHVVQLLSLDPAQQMQVATATAAVARQVAPLLMQRRLHAAQMAVREQAAQSSSGLQLHPNTRKTG